MQTVKAIKWVCLEVNIKKTEYMLLSRHQNAGQNHNIEATNKAVGNVQEQIRI
jgi:hypothetical protein